MSMMSTEPICTENNKYIPGLVIIINDSERSGSEADVQLLRETFIKIGATVVIWSEHCEDQVTTEAHSAKRLKIGEVTEEATKDLQIENDKTTKEFENCQYVVITHCSHGTANGMVTGPAGLYNNLQKLYLNPLFKIKALEHKLKWLIVQACRGENEARSDQATADGLTLYYNKFVLKSYSSQEGEKSYRIKDGTSIYIAKLCAELNRSAAEKDLETILADTAAAVQQYFIDEEFEKFQLPTKWHNFPQYKFFFKTGLTKTTD